MNPFRAAPSLLFTLAVLLPHFAAAQDASTPSPFKPLAQLVIDTAAWHWNWASWDQEKIISVGDYQYTVYWDANRALVLVRRNLKTNAIERLRIESLRLSADDAHRNPCLGVSLADGRLHLSWDHHNNPLRYARSRAGFLTDPPERIAAADIEPPQPIGSEPQFEARVTYPRFFNDAGGDLFLTYRLGGSGAGEDYLYRYDAQSGQWTRLGRLFSSRGTYAPWNNSPTRNAYPHDLLFDAQGRLHATWVYREAGASWASNHDLHYAYSDDGGLTWLNNSGQQIADLTADDPIELADRGIVVAPIPVYAWLMNAGCMAIDSQNRPHVITYKLAGTHRPEKLAHGPPPEIEEQLAFVHYWRADDGTWHGGAPIPDPAAGGTVRRGDIVFDAQDNLYFFYHPRGTQEGFRCLWAQAADEWRQWRAAPLTSPPHIGLDASKHDRRRWRDEGILSFTTMLAPSGFGIVELELAHDSQAVPRGD